MILIEADNATQVIQNVFTAIRDQGVFVGKTVDVLDVHLVLTNPLRSFPYLKKQHWIWALYEGSDRLNPSFENPGQAYRFRPTWQKKLAKERGQFCYTYGEIYRSQLPVIFKKLKSKQTREAIINMWDSRFLFEASERTPCTLVLHFLVREDRLHLFVTMRTNDAMNLLPYDIWHHCLLLRYVAMNLGLGVGEYHHQASHMYYPKRRATSGNIDRVIDEMGHHLTRMSLPEYDPYHTDEDFFSQQFGGWDMTQHFKAIETAREGEFSQSIELQKEIQSPFVADWTATLIMAEGNARGYKACIPVKLPEFKFIHKLGYHLRSR